MLPTKQMEKLNCKRISKKKSLKMKVKKIMNPPDLHHVVREFAIPVEQPAKRAMLETMSIDLPLPKIARLVQLIEQPSNYMMYHSMIPHCNYIFE